MVMLVEVAVLLFRHDEIARGNDFRVRIGEIVVNEVWLTSTEEKCGNLVIPADGWCPNVDLILVIAA